MTMMPRRRGGKVIGGLGAALLVAGGALGAATFFAPDQVEYHYGNARTVVIQTTAGIREQATGDLPTVRFGVSGHIPELDSCDGTFTHMASYEHPEVPPIWAAHNGCQGDAILPWEIGQQVQIEGDDTVYEVVDIRHTPRVWATTADLAGLGGDFALQTCFYGQDQMKFVGLEPALEPA
ncbi:hypothetical protein J4H92_10910 [Leucobacter weissii]|uniref:Uncharacterized protein n=1 Tax=Leucobacter weissii TaxID=1983706 RepID=A0A939SCK7_9MICO|nr:hypothetical protein [Leucobacter weissii]MBO1902458.1 hypothetical protein [Leucobacter weissii]